ncbi:MAG TPA: hypothetical protein VMM36_01665 [Opitutaceae bacterium]|nr:hypothetical protein [Opitutaceae bacterium]
MQNAPPRRRVRLGIVLGILFLFAQGAAFVWAKFVPTRYFCWAPYDQHTFYTITVSHRGRELSELDIFTRYGIPARGHNSRSHAEVLNLVHQYETTYGAGEVFTPTVRYVVNGHPERTWTFARTP